MKSIPPCETVAPEPYDYRVIDKQKDYMKCRPFEQAYWNTEGILNGRVPYEKDLLNGQKTKTNLKDLKVSK